MVWQRMLLLTLGILGVEPLVFQGFCSTFTGADCDVAMMSQGYQGSKEFFDVFYL